MNKNVKARGKSKYARAIDWIALNDEPVTMDDDDRPERVRCETRDLEFIASMISVQLIADVFGKTPEAVADDVRRYRVRVTRPGAR